MNASQFMARHPEFRQLVPGTVQAVLNAAANELNATTLGDAYDEAQGLVAAHKLWKSEAGVSMRMDDKGNERPSPYLNLLRDLYRRVLPRGIVT